MIDRSLKILIINWQDITNPFGGGAEVHLHEIFKRVVALGHEVTLLCCKFKGATSEETIDGIRIIRRGNRSLFNYFVPGAYKDLVKKRPFDVVIDDINKIPFYTPFFVKAPLIGLVHHFFGKSIFLQTSILPALYVYFSERLVPRIYKNIPFAAVSDSTIQEMKDVGIKGNISLLPNAVDLDKYQVLESAKSETPLIGYFGRLKKYKSVDHVLAAFKLVLGKMPDAKLVIVGDGDYRTVLEQIAGEEKIADKVEFTGFVTHEQKIELLNKMWLAVNPSPKEGWGLTVIEANACGTPVIAADSPGLRDSVKDGETGLLYPYGDTNKAAEQILELLKNNDKRNQFSLNAIKWAGTFNWDQSAQKAIQIIENCLVESEKKNAERKSS